MDGGDGKKAGFDLGGLFGGWFSSKGNDPMPDMTGLGTQEQLATGSMQVGQNIGSAMTTAGTQVAQQIQATMTSGATTAGATVKSSMTTGGVSAGANVRTATVQGGMQLKAGVVEGWTQGGSFMAQSISMAGAGGGILEQHGRCRWYPVHGAWHLQRRRIQR